MRSQIYGEFIALNRGGTWSLRCQWRRKRHAAAGSCQSYLDSISRVKTNYTRKSKNATIYFLSDILDVIFIRCQDTWSSLYVSYAFKKHISNVTLDKDVKEIFPRDCLCLEKKLALMRIVTTGSCRELVFIQFSCDNANVTGLLPSSVGYVCYALWSRLLKQQTEEQWPH